MRETSTLTWEEARYTQQLLSECRPEHLVGLVDLLRFGIASEAASGPCVAAAWLLNAARFSNLPRTDHYRRPDGSGFRHCDGDWLESRIAPEGQFQERVTTALGVVGASARTARFNHVGLTAALDRRAPAALITDTTASLVLAFNASRGKLYVCEIEAQRARLKWCALESLNAQRPLLVSLDHDDQSEAAEADREAMSTQVVSASSEEGLRLLPDAQGLSVLAYAALHGHTQRDLSSCQVASLSSVVMGKGARARVVGRASQLNPESSLDTQGALRGAAEQHLRDSKGLSFDFRGLSVEELCEVAQSLGLSVRSVQLTKATPEAIEGLRADVCGSLGRVIINFHRPALGQPGGGHHAVLVAYHTDRDLLLVDDPAGFKTPPYWVSTAKLAAAAATFDTTAGVQRHRGYVVVQGEQGAPDGRSEADVSASIIFGQPRPRR